MVCDGPGLAQGEFLADDYKATGYSEANLDSSLVYSAISANERHWVEDTTGKHAEVGLTVDSAQKLSYSYSLSRDKDQTIVPEQTSLSAKESLDVTSANEIYASINIYNGECDQVLLGAHVWDSSIAGYNNSGTVTDTQATASQSASSASGAGILFGEIAQNANLSNTIGSISGNIPQM